MTAQQQREQRITDLRRKADNHRDEASAFVAAAELLATTEPAHRRFTADWQRIAKRLQHHAATLIAVADQCEQDIARLAGHFAASANFKGGE